MGYRIRSIRDTGTITYYCSTTQAALDKVGDFRRAEYRDIIVVSADEDVIPESQLVWLASIETGKERQASC